MVLGFHYFDDTRRAFEKWDTVLVLLVSTPDSMWVLQILLTLLVVISVRADDECVDLDSRCEDLASMGECVRNPQHMKNLCPVSCEVCEEEKAEEQEEEEEEEEQIDHEKSDDDDDEEAEEEEEESDHEEEGDEDVDEDYDENDENSEDEDDESENMHETDDDDDDIDHKVPEAVFWSSGADLGKPQRILQKDASRPEDMTWMIAKARNYMKEVVPKKFGPEMSKLCRNLHRQCAYWAWKGECDTNAVCKCPSQE